MKPIMLAATAAAALIATALLPGDDVSAQSEREFQDRLCAGWMREHRLENGNRVDCLSGLHAIEVDFTHKWAEAIGQALHYAGETGKRPGVILVCKARAATCARHAAAYEATLAKWRLDIDTWHCPRGATLLGDCRLTGPHAICRATGR